MALDLGPIKAREASASAEPWERKAYRVHAPAEPIPDRILAACWRPWGPVTGPGSIEADAEFIAHARTDVPALVAEIEQLRADLGIANEATLVLLARATEAEATVQRLIAQADGASRRVAELEVRSLADEVRAAQEATRTLRDLAPVRDGEEPDPDEEPCRCCSGPGFGRGEHLHDEKTCEHPCCPARDE